MLSGVEVVDSIGQNLPRSGRVNCSNRIITKDAFSPWNCDQSCEYTNTLVAQPTAEFMDLIAEHGVSFENAAVARQHDDGDHNRREHNGQALFLSAS